MDEVRTTYRDDIAIASRDSGLQWEKFSGCNILVTGATGLIGSCLLEILARKDIEGCNLFALGRNRDKFLQRFGADSGKISFIEADVTATLPCNCRFDYIFDLAGAASPDLYSTAPVDVMNSNYLGLDNLLRYATGHGTRKLLFVSSGEVYGEGDGNAVREDYSGKIAFTGLRSCYPSAKRACETLCIAYSHQYGIEVSIARPCHVYGPHFSEKDTRVYAQFIRNAREGRDIVMKSEGRQFRSWCYVVDCASALLYIMLNGSDRAAYNIADESSNITIAELAAITAEAAGTKTVFELPDEVEKRGYSKIQKAVFDTSALRELGWEPRTCIKEGIRKSI